MGVSVVSNGSVAHNPPDCVSVLFDFWDRFWNQNASDHPDTELLVDNLLASAVSHDGGTWEYPTGKDLRQATVGYRSAAGADGWSGQELAALPTAVWDTFVCLANQWAEKEELPVALTQAITVFIPKNSKITNNCVPVQHLRPITILSRWWRLWMRAWLQTNQMQEWAQTILPEEIAYGAGCDSQVAASKILDSYSQLGFIASLDFSKCFDLLRPQLCGALLRQAGWDARMSSLVAQLWSGHQRWICYDNCYHPDVLVPRLALPQGDPLGPLVASLYMSAGLRQVQNLAGLGPVKTQVWMDDRTVVASSAEDLHQQVTAWAEWSSSVGLVENLDKLQVSCQNPRNVDQLSSFFDPSAVKTEVTFLGVASVSKRRKHVEVETDRLKSTKDIVRTLASLQLPGSVFYKYCRIFAISRCAYGWLGRQLPLSDARKIWTAMKAAAGVARSANEWAQAVVCGGLSHLDCVQGSTLVRVGYRLFQQGCQWGASFGSPVRTLRTWMTDHDWHETQPWTWKHKHSGNSLDFTAAGFDIAACRHVLRAHWRIWCFDQFLQVSRREVPDCSQISLAEFERVAWDEVRRHIDCDPAARTVALGAQWSPAALHHRPGADTSCPWCDTLGTWNHVAWDCCQSPVLHLRPPRPCSGIARRFGWDSSLEVLTYLAQVQRALWEAHHG